MPSVFPAVGPLSDVTRRHPCDSSTPSVAFSVIMVVVAPPSTFPLRHENCLKKSWLRFLFEVSLLKRQHLLYKALFTDILVSVKFAFTKQTPFHLFL